MFMVRLEQICDYLLILGWSKHRLLGRPPGLELTITELADTELSQRVQFRLHMHIL